MSISRRRFIELTGSAAVAATFADELFGLPPLFAEGGSTKGKPQPHLVELATVALTQAKKLGASYADIRINRYRDQFTSLRSQPDITTGKVNNIPNLAESQSFGFGVRVIANGTWGFASSPIVTKAEIARVTGEAVAVAKANSALQKAPVQLAKTPVYVDTWITPFETNPFDVPIPEKLALLEKVNNEIRSVPKVFSSNASVSIHSEDKFFASSEGSQIQQYVLQTVANSSAQARDLQTRISRSRNYNPPPQTGGWEIVEKADLIANGKRIGEEVVEHLTAPAGTTGKRDLILMPNNLALTIHESIGHSTELDRAIGYEANYAGTSFLTLDKLGKYRVGSEWLNVQGDRTLPGAMATVGYDDDGVKTTSFPIMDKGIFVGYQTIRDQAHIVGEKTSRGCCNADSWDSVPFQRMPNVWLKPNPKEMTLDELISGVDDGILIDGRGSWSIDQQRYNFQFGGDAFWEIKGGKKRNMISRVAYQARTDDFWQKLDGVCDQRFWVNQGLNSDGKGEPGQINAMSHGCAPSRFRGINILQTD